MVPLQDSPFHVDLFSKSAVGLIGYAVVLVIVDEGDRYE
jgi:hypothetical protein